MQRTVYTQSWRLAVRNSSSYLGPQSGGWSTTAGAGPRACPRPARWSCLGLGTALGIRAFGGLGFRSCPTVGTRDRTEQTQPFPALTLAHPGTTFRGPLLFLAHGRSRLLNGAHTETCQAGVVEAESLLAGHAMRPTPRILHLNSLCQLGSHRLACSLERQADALAISVLPRGTGLIEKKLVHDIPELVLDLNRLFRLCPMISPGHHILATARIF